MFSAAYKQVKNREDQREQRYRRLQERRLGLVLQGLVRETQKQMELQQNKMRRKDREKKEALRRGGRTGRRASTTARQHWNKRTGDSWSTPQSVSSGSDKIRNCSEIYTETPTSFDAQAQTYSNYKNITLWSSWLVSLLVAQFLSCFNPGHGRVSNKNLIQELGFLSCLEPGDVILADRGFTVGEDIQFVISTFTKGKKQFLQEEVEMSKQLAHVRIHVESLLKNKYTLLKGLVPVSYCLSIVNIPQCLD